MTTTADQTTARRATKRHELTERLDLRDGVLSRTDLRTLGYERRAIDAIFRACPVEVWPGYTRPMIRVADFLEWREKATYRGDRVRPTQ